MDRRDESVLPASSGTKCKPRQSSHEYRQETFAADGPTTNVNVPKLTNPSGLYVITLWFTIFTEIVLGILRVAEYYGIIQIPI